MTRRAIAAKWILYCLCALALVLVQGLVLVHIQVWGVHPFLLPAIAVIPATLERGEQAFLAGAAIAWVLSGQVIVAGLVCSLTVTAAAMLLCGLLHMAVLAGQNGASLATAASLLGREMLLTLPFAAAAHPLLRWVQRRTQSE